MRILNRWRAPNPLCAVCGHGKKDHDSVSDFCGARIQQPPQTNRVGTVYHPWSYCGCRDWTPA